MKAKKRKQDEHPAFILSMDVFLFIGEDQASFLKKEWSHWVLVRALDTLRVEVFHI
jgi:hypothetical protein